MNSKFLLWISYALVAAEVTNNAAYSLLNNEKE